MATGMICQPLLILSERFALKYVEGSFYFVRSCPNKPILACSRVTLTLHFFLKCLFPARAKFIQSPSQKYPQKKRKEWYCTSFKTDLTWDSVEVQGLLLIGASPLSQIHPCPEVCHSKMEVLLELSDNEHGVEKNSLLRHKFCVSNRAESGHLWTKTGLQTGLLQLFFCTDLSSSLCHCRIESFPHVLLNALVPSSTGQIGRYASSEALTHSIWKNVSRSFLYFSFHKIVPL